MSGCGTRTAVGPFGDFAIGDVFESVAYWLPADRGTLDALSHSCSATRRHLAHSPSFVDATLVCRRGCHVRCYTPRKRLAVQRVKFEAMWRLRECIHSVQALSLSVSRTTDDELAALLSCCPNVTGLDVCNCPSLTDTCTTAISRCPITSLNMSGCSKISDRGAKELSRLALTTLSLSKCDVGDNGLKEISRCPLTALNLRHCAISDNGLKEISRCPLTALDLRHCMISDNGLKRDCALSAHHT